MRRTGSGLRWLLLSAVTASAILVGTTGATAATLPGITHHYAADGTAADSAGSSDGTLVGAAGFAPGQSGQAFDLSAGGYLQLDPSLLNVGTSDLTVAFWVKGSPSPGGFTPFLSKRADNLNFVSVNGGSNGVASVELRRGGDYMGWNGTRNVLDGQWHHLAVVRQGAYAALYVDGALDSDSSGYAGGVVDLGADPTYAAQPVTLGASLLYPGGTLNGLLDDVQFYPAALTPADLATIIGAAADTVPPVISGTPGPISAPATSIAGAAVAYVAPTASDAVDGPVAVTCLPASGSVFPIGQTTVICSAGDAAGNAASTSFTVTVTTAPPVVTASLVSLNRGGDDESEQSFRVVFSAADPIGVASVVATLNGVAVANGQIVKLKLVKKGAQKVKRDDGRLQIQAPSFLLTVTATDALGGSTTQTAAPVFVKKGKNDES